MRSLLKCPGSRRGHSAKVRTPPFFCRETPQSKTASDSCHSTHSNTSRSSRLNEGKQTKELQSAEMRRQDHRRAIHFAGHKCDTVVPQSHDTGEKKWRKRNGLNSGPSSPEIFIHHCGLAVDTAVPGHRGLHSGLSG
ncbi:hypothetical protein AOLI_G00191320 [Acnodon oligacanthus]